MPLAEIAPPLTVLDEIRPLQWVKIYLTVRFNQKRISLKIIPHQLQIVLRLKARDPMQYKNIVRTQSLKGCMGQQTGINPTGVGHSYTTIAGKNFTQLIITLF